jgi:4-deoxy-L-threo-5-hexosulose-uronate ketol-isomerase
METRYSVDIDRYERLTQDELRKAFLIEDLFVPGQLKCIYWENERAVVGGIVPTESALKLVGSKELATDQFAERREIGIINTGAKGTVKVDGTTYELEHKECLYIGRGAKDIQFTSASASDPAYFYLISYTAHMTYPTAKLKIADAMTTTIGKKEVASERTLRKYIHADGVKSCQLVMGYTETHEGSVWNTMPCHTHERRTEIYCYFGLAEDQAVMHFMGRPDRTRHIVIRNRQVVLSPIWSVHFGAGTAPYPFIWSMGGENQAFADMDQVPVKNLK